MKASRRNNGMIRLLNSSRQCAAGSVVWDPLTRDDVDIRYGWQLNCEAKDEKKGLPGSDVSLATLPAVRPTRTFIRLSPRPISSDDPQKRRVKVDCSNQSKCVSSSSDVLNKNYVRLDLQNCSESFNWKRDISIIFVCCCHNTFFFVVHLKFKATFDVPHATV